MQALSMAFSPRFVVLTLAFLMTLIFVVLIATGGMHYARVFFVWGRAAVRRPDSARPARSRPDATRGAAQLPDLGASALSARRAFGRRCGSISSRARRTACRSAATSAPSSISAPRGSSTSGRSARSSTSTPQGYEWLNHSIAPKPVATEAFRVAIGGPDCAKPYSASVFNISAMSFGALSANAIRALNDGAKRGGFAHDTGEGGYQSLSPRERRRHHLGDRLGLFRLPQRRTALSTPKVRRGGSQRQIKMIEIKLSPGRQARPRRRAARRPR